MRRIYYDPFTRRMDIGEFVLSAAEEAAFEARWQEIKNKYKSVYIYLLYYISIIGEMVGRYLLIRREERDEDALYVLLPSDEVRFGVQVANRFACEYIGVCGEEDLDFWWYVLLRHRGDINEDIDRFVIRDSLPCFFQKAYSVGHHFTDEQVERGEEALKAMGVTGPFVCLAARTSKYTDHIQRFKTFPRIPDDESIYAHRNMDFRDYGKAIAWLGEQGIQCVKMGRFEDPLDPPIPNCIDYAGYHASDFMDLYTFSRCDFTVSCMSGIALLANLFAKPVLYVNSGVFSVGNAGVPYTEHDMFITKTFYAADTGVYRHPMTFREKFDAEKDRDISLRHLIERGIKWSDNTEDEILDAVKEMVARIDGTWADTEEDEIRLERWWQLCDEMEVFRRGRDHLIKLDGGGPLPIPPATTFLRRHPYLVE